MIVLGVLGALMVIVMMVINPNLQFVKARDVKRKSDLDSIYKALIMYKNDYNSYPESSGNPNFQIRGCIPLTTFTWGGGSFKCGDMTYMKSLPQDPSKGSSTYKYTQSATGNDFCLWATLEKTDDPDIAMYKSRCTLCTVGVNDIVVCSD